MQVLYHTRAQQERNHIAISFHIFLRGLYTENPHTRFGKISSTSSKLFIALIQNLLNLAIYVLTIFSILHYTFKHILYRVIEKYI